ncbi:MAG: DUF2726 domain-containing protein [Pseudomonadota bacterium]|nr:DUF2726 domain-containing protein [Pseudomonadota bacterium]
MHPWIGQLLGLGLGLLAGLGLGALLYAWRLERINNIKLRLPVKWPLAPRGLVNGPEEKVWTWLREVFHDHRVLVKIPVLRFTSLIEKDKPHASTKEKAEAKAENERWLERLSGIYTTFTICTAEGKVVGCVDVPGKTPASKASRELKETLLSDCGIAYTLVAPAKLPETSAMRAAFLGEIPVEESVQQSESIQGVDTTFRADLKSFTIQEVKEKKTAALKTLNKGF